MQITALGHSCVLLDFVATSGGPRTRILVDPWLSDHATGDGMGRFPRLRFDPAELGPIHGVFLSHAHSDHLDPYTLVRLWRSLPEPPVLLLPVSLAFLVPVFTAHLPGCAIQLLEPHTPTPFRGVELLGFFDLGLVPSNEDDVMVLVVRCDDEVALVEADANLSLEVPEFRAYVSELLTGPGVTSAVYLTTENELTGTLLSPGCASLDDRADLVELATNTLLESVEALYAPTPEGLEDPGDLWRCPHLLRLIHGQGLTAPHELDPRWQRILFPVRPDHRVAEERAAAARWGCAHRIDRLTDGATHTVRGGRLEAVAPCPALTLLDDDADRRFDPQLAFFPDLPCAPLRDGPRDTDAQRERVLALLNQRFLPFLHGQRHPPLLHLLAAGGGAYRVRVHHGNTDDMGSWDYVLGFDGPAFTARPAGAEPPDEEYWGADLEDFLDGRCDEVSTFCRAALPAPEARLQACLATPLLNSDLVEKRVRLHFERAAAGQTPGGFVLPRYGLPGDAAG